MTASFTLNQPRNLPMALSIHTNYSSLVTQTNLNKTNNALSTNQQRLGTGLRINSAADDAAGLQIATRLNAQSRGMAVAMRNTGDAVSLLQTAEGAFNEMTDILQRMKDLATQGANGTNSADDLTALQSEYDELGKELANIMDNTSYAGEALFSKDNSVGKFAAEVTFQIGATSAETLSMDLTATGSDAIQTLTDAIDEVSAAYTAGAAVATTGDEITATASDTIDLVSTALDAIGSLRAQFGANINRLNHTANNLANMRDNTEMAKGRIMDADFASESANMSKNSMLMQSGISMLKQAGQMPGMVMSLLG
jgi:flagellin